MQLIIQVTIVTRSPGVDFSNPPHQVTPPKATSSASAEHFLDCHVCLGEILLIPFPIASMYDTYMFLHFTMNNYRNVGVYIYIFFFRLRVWYDAPFARMH